MKYCSCNIKYILPVITEKGAIVMIMCNMLALTAAFAQGQRICLKTSTTITVRVLLCQPKSNHHFSNYWNCCWYTCKRYKITQASVALLMASSLFNILLIFLQDYLLTIAEDSLYVLCTNGLCCIGTSCYVACAFPFAADQLIGTSGEQLSFAVYWMMWGFVIAYHTKVLKGIPVIILIL